LNATTVVLVLSGPSGVFQFPCGCPLRPSSCLPSPLPSCFGISRLRRRGAATVDPTCHRAPCEAQLERGPGSRWRGILGPPSERTIINRRLVYVAPRGSRRLGVYVSRAEIPNSRSTLIPYNSKLYGFAAFFSVAYISSDPKFS